MRPVLCLIALTLVCGCRESGPSPEPATAVVPEGSATAPAFEREGDTMPAKAEPAEPAETEEPKVAKDESENDEAEPDAEGTGEAETDQDADEAAPEPATPLPAVEVRNVGMHIGGEKNTNEQKRPIRATISKHYDAMKRCWGKAVDPPKKATFGVDIRIEGAGGPAKITNPRNGLKGEGVTECLVGVFEAIDFPPQPHKADRMVSYSIEFTKG